MICIVSVIGGINVDIKGFSKEMIMKTSNPGKVNFSCGGVGRNIAENLAKLNLPVKLFGVVGNDFFGNYVIEETKSSGVDVSNIEFLSNGQTGVYLSIVDDHDMLISISDMNLIEYVDKNYIDKYEKEIFNSMYIILDTNLKIETLKYIVYKNIQYKKKIIVNTVSFQKAKRIYNIKNDLHYIITNLHEFNSLYNIKLKNLNELKEFNNYSELCDIIITLGEKGVYDLKRKKHYKPLKADVLDVNGAGDAFLSGFVYGIYNDKPIDESIYYGQCAAVITLESPKTVSEHLSEEIIKHMLGN